MKHRLATKLYRMLLITVLAALLVMPLTAVMAQDGVVGQPGSGNASIERARQQEQVTSAPLTVGEPVKPAVYVGDVRDLPYVAPVAPVANLNLQYSAAEKLPPAEYNPESTDTALAPNAMPTPSANFAGLGKNSTCTGGSCGSGWPPDTVGDVGPNHYIQAVNTAVGIYNKTGAQLAAFTFNSLWSGAGTGTACDSTHRGDPTVIYD
ncbi:hypothetical protein [Candidatus Amarolinea aalborgensis]|uniref:hypothetical protein n=1 Tax=Candidatus Amarolinea aalborgensis TaxID=2249329 RepID=UPI003BF954D6